MIKINSLSKWLWLAPVFLMTACKPFVDDYLYQPLVFLQDARMTYCKNSLLGRTHAEVRAEEPELAPYYCVTEPLVGTIEQGTYFHIINIPYRGTQTCFKPPQIVIDSGRFKGQIARLMYHPMQMKNPGVNGCRFRLPIWVKPAGVVTPEMKQMKRLPV